MRNGRLTHLTLVSDCRFGVSPVTILSNYPEHLSKQQRRRQACASAHLAEAFAVVTHNRDLEKASDKITSLVLLRGCACTYEGAHRLDLFSHEMAHL